MSGPDLGGHVARSLRGAWRPDPASPAVDADELKAVLPTLVETNVAGLAWRTVRADPSLATSPAGRTLHDAARMAVLSGAVRERGFAQALTGCAAAGIEPLIVKGWATARRYPEPGLRAYCDFDLVFRAEDASEGRRLAERDRDPDRPEQLDFDHAFLVADRTDLDALHARGARAECGGRPVRVLAPEDELRLAAVHFVGSGGWRATSLCDVALAIETASDDFDWTLAIPADPARASWVRLAAGLAARVLGARLEDTPLAGAEREIPSWAARVVRTGIARQPYEAHPAPFWRTPGRRYVRAVRARWPPNPLTASVQRGAAVGRRPPRASQAAYVVRRTGAGLRSLRASA